MMSETSSQTDAAAEPRHVLVTGSAGAIGAPVCEELARRGHQVRGLDRVPSPVVEDHVVADLTDRAAIDHAMRDIQSVVHLAAVPVDRPFMEELLGPNVIGLFHVMDAARAVGAERVTLASSGQAISGYPRDQRPLPADLPPKPTNHYGLTKAWAEQMGEMYARQYGMSVIAVRIGWLPRKPTNPDDIGPEHSLHDSYISPGDAGRFFAGCLEAGGIDFVTLHATGPGRPEGPRYDLEPARRLLGYEPRDRWPEGFHLLTTSA